MAKNSHANKPITIVFKPAPAGEFVAPFQWAREKENQKPAKIEVTFED